MANLEDNDVDGPTTLVEPVSQPDDDYCAHALYEGSESMLDWSTLEDAEVIDITSGRELSDNELRSRLGLEA